MKYQCCVCGSNFDASQIKDDFKNGVTEGFLCPLCGANIKDDLSGQTSFDKKAKGTFTFYALLVALFFLQDNIEEYVSRLLGINNGLTLVTLMFVVIFTYALANKNLLKESNILITQRVDT
ncbi:MAG: hypothetical protein HRU20_13980 [Pseudomonadales bacterium]|nr:hypothetical protein [Pseudomonadales bacterium]